MSELLDPQTLIVWLEWAGIRLIAMPGGRVGPADYRVFWPDYGQDRFQILHHRAPSAVRVAPPDGRQISIVETILLLPNLCEKPVVRRVLHARSLLHPANMRHLYPWPRIATTLEIKVASAKYMHKVGLQEVCRKVDEQTVCSISRRLAEAA